jgi:hypothetical protein
MLLYALNNIRYFKVKIVGDVALYQLMNTDELGYKDSVLCDTLAVALHLLYQLIPHKACVPLPCLVRRT